MRLFMSLRRLKGISDQRPSLRVIYTVSPSPHLHRSSTPRRPEHFQDHPMGPLSWLIQSELALNHGASTYCLVLLHLASRRLIPDGRVTPALNTYAVLLVALPCRDECSVIADWLSCSRSLWFWLNSLADGLFLVIRSLGILFGISKLRTIQTAHPMHFAKIEPIRKAKEKSRPTPKG